MRKIYLLICMFLFSLSLFAQSAGGLSVKRGDSFYNQFDFSNAITVYERVAKKNPENMYVKGKIGNCYKFLNQVQKSEEWYGPVANTEGTDPIFTFYYAQALMSNGKYDEAMQQLNNYYSKMGNSALSNRSYNPEVFTENASYSIKIEDFNSKNADFSPYLLKDELYFVSNRKDDAYVVRDDVWSDRPFTQLLRIKQELKDISQNSDSTKVEDENKPDVFNKTDVSKKYHEGPISWDRNTNDIYMTRSNYTKKKAVKGVNDVVNLKILKVAFVEDKTSTDGTGDFGGVMVDNTSFSSDDYSVAYPSVTLDGKYMIFASDMPGGFGGLDLYSAQNIGGMWSNPQNLGDKINTPGNDAFPHIMADGTLFYASDGLLGLGGYDIYESKLNANGYFAEPENLRSPINSTYDDFGLWMDDNFTNGYFTSNRPSDFGDDDIYSFTRKGFVFEAIVYDSKTNELLDSAVVILTNLENGNAVTLISNEDGYVTSSILPNSKYALNVEKNEYLPESAEFNTMEDDIYAEIPLVKDFGIVLDVTVIDEDTKLEIPFAEVTLVNLKTAEETKVTTNKYGKTSFVVDPDMQYRLRGAAEHPSQDSVYFAVTQDFNTFGTKAPAQLYTTIELKAQCTGCEIVIENILYDLDKYYIRPDAALILDNLVKVLKDNPTIEIELASHTDCRASEKYNMWLSSKRAEAAVDYIISKGIDYRRLTAAGYGETQPLPVAGAPGLYCTCEGTTGPGKTDPRCTEAVHQLNRRTTFTITKK